MTTVMTVNFHGNALYGERIGNIVYVALKPIVEAMGLNWSGQEQRVKREPTLSQGICVMHIPSPRGGGKQEVLGLRLDLLPGWLFTISALRIKGAQIRERIILYQRECYGVLAEHFLGLRAGPTVAQQSLAVRMAHEARLLYGKRAGAEVWIAQGLPKTPAMTDPLEQDDLFTWGRRQLGKRKKAA